MAIIGTFEKQADGSYAGSIQTLGLRVEAQLRPLKNESGKGPDFRLIAGGAECGAAWRKTSKDRRAYLSVKLDDPSFPAPVHASLLTNGGASILIWSRARPSR